MSLEEMKSAPLSPAPASVEEYGEGEGGGDDRPGTAATDHTEGEGEEEHEHDEEKKSSGPFSPGKSGGQGGKPAKVISPFHASLLSTIQSSPMLTPIHAEVRNLSYWYQSRKKLGPKRQAALLTTQMQSGKWESSIYKMKARDEDMEIVPQKVFLNTHKSKWAAFKNCEKECKARDANPADSNPDFNPDLILESHFHLVIVSTQYDRLLPAERLQLTYEALLLGMGVQLTPTSTSLPTQDIQDTNMVIENAWKKNEGKLRPWQKSDVNYHRYSHLGPRVNNAGYGTCPPTKMKGLGSLFGQNTCNLEVFRVLLPTQKVTLIIEAKTPSQWKPQDFIAPASERFGRTHLGDHNSHVPKSLQTAGQTARVKLLAHVAKDSNRWEKFASQTTGGGGHGDKGGKGSGGASGLSKSVNSLTEALGLDSSISGISYGKKKGGIYGHFFSDLPESIKSMLILKYQQNKLLIQTEGNHNYIEEAKKNKGKKPQKKEENVPVTGMSKLRDKMMAAVGQADPDVGTQSESEMMEQVYMGARIMERAVIRLQRMRRAGRLWRNVKVVWWRKWAIVNIQRIFRGKIAQKYVHLLRRLRPVAAARIQKLFRSKRKKRIITVWQGLSYRLTRWVMPKIKRFLRNCFLQNIAKYYDKAVTIQKVLRMFLVKNRYQKKLAERNVYGYEPEWRLFYHEQVIKVQRILRGNWGRARFLTFIEGALVMRVDVPASILIQKRYRGVLGRRKSARARYVKRCVALLQRVARAYVQRVWKEQMRIAKRRIDAATSIQRISRGRIDRVLVEYIRIEHHYKYKFMPAVFLTQRQIRGWIARKFVRRKILERRSATICVNFWRGVLARRAMLALWKAAREKYIYSCAAQIQKIVRCFLCKKVYPVKLQMAQGKALYAAKVIMRAWVTFVQSKRMQLLLDDNRQSFYKAKLPKFEDARNEIKADREEILGDIKMANNLLERYRARMKVLDNFQVEAQLRTSIISKEMTLLTPDDFDSGWGDAFGEEFEVLGRQMKMAKEEERLLRHRILVTNRELTVLYCELEDVEIEMDHIGTLEISAYEGMRRAAVGRIERRVLDAKRRLVRMERCKWKTEAVRLHVIQRQRPGYQIIKDKAKKGRDMDYARTVVYEKRQQRRDYEQLREQKMHEADGRAAELLGSTYESYAKPVQTTYDSIVSGNMALLRGFTLEERAARVKKQYKDRAIAKRNNAGGQFSVLKKFPDLFMR